MFKLIRIENGRMNVPSPAYYEVTANEAVYEGEALVLNAGKLTKCGTTTKPDFIAMGDKTATAEDRMLAVSKCAPNQIYEVEGSGTTAPTSLVPGAKIKLGADGLTVVADTTSGVVTVENLNGAAAAGDTIIVRIV